MRFALLLAGLLSLTAWAGTVTLPPASAGEINGRTALLMWPASADGEPIEPSNCKAHLVPYSDQDQELLFPCGEWFQPPVGKYRYWLEKDDAFMSPSPTIVVYAGPKFTGAGLRGVLPVLPAGKVALRAPFPAEQSLRLLHIPSGSSKPAQHRSMDRRARADSVVPLLMPEGEVIAGVFDRKSGDAVALTRPVRVQRDKVAYVNPQPPKEGCDVLAVFDRPGIRPRSQTDDAAPVLRTPQGDRPPDVLSDTANRVIAVWYGISARSAELIFKSSAELVPTETLRLVPGHAVTIRRAISSLPAADVDIRAPDSLGRLKLEVETTRLGTSETIRTLDVVPGRTRVENLPAEKLTFGLSFGEWRLTRSVDLTAGVDGHADFDIEPLAVEGDVFLGDRKATAALSFGNGKRDFAETETDADGHFRVNLWAPGVYMARVVIPEAEPFLQGFIDIDEPHTDLDFHVPHNLFRVRVSDKRSGKAIGNALVGVSSTFGKQADYKQMESTRTGEDGIAKLPPLRTGSAEVRAGADGYQESAPMPFVVDDETRGRQLEIALEPFGDRIAVQILDANGLPALGAELRLIANPGDDRPLWQAPYDSPDGVHVPLVRENALLLIRHHGSASRVIMLSRDIEPSIRLAAEAPPLVVRTQTETGEPAPFARSGMWFGPYRMTTMSLGFLTWSQSGVASRDGIWVARGLSPSGTRIFAWRKNTATAVAGGFDALATTITHPWAEVVTLRTVD
jgi:hypothetical protein